MELLDGISVCLSMVWRDFDTASPVMFLLRLSELPEEWTHKKSVESLTRSMSPDIDWVWMETENREELIPLHQVQTEDQMVIRIDSMIPLDGTIAEGEVMLNQASLTGEFIPAPKRSGSSVYAGTVVEEDECAPTITQQSGKGRYDRIAAMTEELEQLESATENHAARLADRLVPYTLAGSVLVYLLTRNVTRVPSALMVDFSCASKLSMPLAVPSIMSKASRFHVTVRCGKYLGAVTQADTTVFGKTGILTHANPVVAQVVPLGGNREPEILRLTACLEEHFPYSIANVMVRVAREQDLAYEEMYSQVEYLTTHGVASTVDGGRVITGNVHFVFEGEGCTVPPGEQAAFDTLPKQYSHLYLAAGNMLTTVTCVPDPLRAEVADAVATLCSLGVGKIVVLIGDSEHTTAAIAVQVRVDEYRAEVLPEDKAHFMQTERSQGHAVVMIGDGINDSSAPSAASVGIAISDDAAIAQEIADITIATNDLFEPVQLQRLSMALINRIQSNYRFVTGFSGGLITLGALGALALATFVTLHNLSTLGISLRSMTGLLPPAKAWTQPRLTV